MTNTQKLMAGGVIGGALLSGYALMGGNDSAKSSTSRDNTEWAKDSLPNGEKDRDCSDFRTQREAQEFFEANGGPSKDSHNLDRDKDGRVCETLK